MELQNDGTYIFSLRNKVYKLEFEGNSPVVTLNSDKQKAITILKEYINENKLPIDFNYLKGNGEIEKLTTNGLGGRLRKYLTSSEQNENKKEQIFKVNKKIITTKKEVKLENKLKADYNRRKKNNLNDFETYEQFKNWYYNQDKKCSYCDIKEDEIRFIVLNGLLKSKRFPENGVLKQGKARGFYLEVDRKNSNLNYSTENCVLACYFCNNDKSDVFDFDSYNKFFLNRRNYLLDLIDKYNNKL